MVIHTPLTNAAMRAKLLHTHNVIAIFEFNLELHFVATSGDKHTQLVYFNSNIFWQLFKLFVVDLDACLMSKCSEARHARVVAMTIATFLPLPSPLQLWTAAAESNVKKRNKRHPNHNKIALNTTKN